MFLLSPPSISRCFPTGEAGTGQAGNPGSTGGHGHATSCRRKGCSHSATLPPHPASQMPQGPGCSSIAHCCDRLSCPSLSPCVSKPLFPGILFLPQNSGFGKFPICASDDDIPKSQLGDVLASPSPTSRARLVEVTWFHTATWYSWKVISIPRSRWHIGCPSQLPHEPAAAMAGREPMLRDADGDLCQQLPKPLASTARSPS